ncbi:MAG: endonuclease/exonuclease/phosphatase family protein [Sulfurimonadaceae bacterium]
MFPQKLHHQEHNLPKEFSLLVWNVHKENLRSDFQERFKSLLQQHPSEFLLFQEAKYPKKSSSVLDDFSYAMASNIETFRHLYGVVTASKVAFEKIDSNLSHRREIGLITYKSMQITQHKLSNGQILHLVNLHSINFVSIKIFTKELEKIKLELKMCKGPMIVGGDFNNWTKKRIKVIEAFQHALSLEKAELHEKHHIKHIFEKPLDHLFYRDLNLLQAKAIDTQKISDHNPIYATFSCI